MSGTIVAYDGGALIVSIAIEMGGWNPMEHRLLAIGIVVGCNSGILEHKHWCLQQYANQVHLNLETGTEWSASYYGKGPVPEGYARIIREQRDPDECLREMVQFLESLPSKYHTENIILVSSDPLDDIGMLDTICLLRGITKASIRYISGSKWRVVDPKSMTFGEEPHPFRLTANTSRQTMKRADEKTKHDTHWPVDKAEHHYWWFIFACKDLDAVDRLRRTLRTMLSTD